MISELFIHRPKFAIVIAILMVLAGVICVSRIPIAEYPEIAPPTINVRTTHEGASAQTVMETVGIPLEQELNGLENLLYFSSTSDNSGGYSVNISAIMYDDTKCYVYIVNSDNIVEQRDVLLGNMMNNRQCIRSGIKEGDIVIVDGQHKTRPGATVIPVESN